jgi:hypothetical protein
MSEGGNVELDIPRVTDRREWHVRQTEDGQIEFSYRGNHAGHCFREIDRFNKAMRETDGGDGLTMGTLQRDGDSVVFRVPPDRLDQLSGRYDYPNIKTFKHG